MSEKKEGLPDTKCVKLPDGDDFCPFDFKNYSTHFQKRPAIIRALRLEVPVAIETLEGTMTGQVGDWLIEGVNGEFYPCKHDIFKKSYEKVKA